MTARPCDALISSTPNRSERSAVTNGEADRRVAAHFHFDEYIIASEPTARCFGSVHLGVRHGRRARRRSGIEDKRKPWLSKVNGTGTEEDDTTWRAGSRETQAAWSILCQGQPPRKSDTDTSHTASTTGLMTIPTKSDKLSSTTGNTSFPLEEVRQRTDFR